MATYTPAQVADAMRRAGFPESEIATGVAVATAESGRRSEATNRGTAKTPEYSVGPWQINLNAHGKAITEDAARDLDTATAYAYRLWKSSGWQPWGVYTAGTYRQYLAATPEPGSEGPAQKVLARQQEDNMEPPTPSVAQQQLNEARLRATQAASSLDEVLDPKWREEYIARRMHAIAADPTKPNAPIRPGPAGPDGKPTIVVDWDAARALAEKELTAVEEARQKAYDRASDNAKQAISEARLQAGSDRDALLFPIQVEQALANLNKTLQGPQRAERTPEQTARDRAQAIEALARAEYGVPAQAARDVAGADLARAQADELRRKILPEQLRAIQDGLQTITYIRDQMANGALSPQEADQYFTAVQQHTLAGLRGSTPALDEKERQTQITERAKIGRDILNQQVASSAQLAGSLTQSYQQLLSKALEPPTEVFNPLQAASLFTAGMGGGLTDKGTLEIANLLMQGLSGGGPSTAPETAGSGTIDWASMYPNVELASLTGPDGELPPDEQPAEGDGA